MGIDAVLFIRTESATPAMSDDSALRFSFPGVVGRKTSAAFDVGRLTSDGRVLLLAQAGRRMGLATTLAASALTPDPNHCLPNQHPDLATWKTRPQPTIEMRNSIRTPITPLRRHLLHAYAHPKGIEIGRDKGVEFGCDLAPLRLVEGRLASEKTLRKMIVTAPIVLSNEWEAEVQISV